MKKFIFILGMLIFYSSTYSQPIFEELPEIGEIEVILHPGSTITSGSRHLVSFGVPFPRNTVNNISQILITDEQGNELASDIKELTRWHSLSDNPNVNGVRAALLYVNIQFNDLNPKTINVRYGQNRDLEIGDQGDVKDNWVVVNDPEDEYNDDPNDPRYIEIREPSVYATLSPEWMSICVIRNKFIPTNQVSPDYQWYDDALVNFGKTAINDVSDTVLEEHKVVIDSPDADKQGPWLFDRGGCLWNIYMKTGELKWL